MLHFFIKMSKYDKTHVRYLLSCVLKSSQMFPIIFKPREICTFIRGNGAFVAATTLEETPDVRMKKQVGERD